MQLSNIKRGRIRKVNYTRKRCFAPFIPVTFLPHQHTRLKWSLRWRRLRPSGAAETLLEKHTHFC